MRSTEKVKQQLPVSKIKTVPAMHFVEAFHIDILPTVLHIKISTEKVGNAGNVEKAA